MKKTIIGILFLGYSVFLGQHWAQAMEGGGSNFFPGSSGIFAVAVAPEPGFMVANQMLFYQAKLSEAVLNGRVDANLKTDAFYNYIAGFYTFKESVLGGRFQLGGAVPIGYAHFRAGTNSALGSRGVSDANTNIGDALIAPALYWKAGDFHFKLVETIYLPTGDYSTDRLANIGRNYWGFDTSFGITWLNMKTGTEVSVIPGIMFNTKNDKTDYQSGSEFHVDFMVNQFLTETFALGAHGYYYSQLSGDRGSGAKLGDFKGMSLGIGPALVWMPGFAKSKLSLSAKWLHDVDHKNRMKADYGLVTVGYVF